jgi:hypothetical protein
MSEKLGKQFFILIFFIFKIMFMQALHYAPVNTFRTVILAGLIAGSLDILSAFTDYYIRTGKGPEGVLRFIASGVFGKDAFTGDSIMIWLGLLLHFVIAFAFTTVFFILYPRVKFLHISIILTAFIFGMFAWLIMNLVVVPLSNTPKIPFNPIYAIKAMLILICMIGLPLSSRALKSYQSQCG